MKDPYLMISRKFISGMKASFLLIFIVLPLTLMAQSDALRKKHYNNEKSIGLEGFDPVSYFQAVPVEGEEDLTYTHKGVTYLFTTPANLNKFKTNPDKYEPAYGGWCAYAMGENGEKVKVDPETYKIIEGRLYLFYNFWGRNTLEDWNKNEKKLKEAADKNWSILFR